MTPETKEVIKQKGLKAAEDHMIMALDQAIEIGEVMVNETSTPFDNVALTVIKTFRNQIKDFIDKLDGVANQ
jgi:hypothetical protein